MKENFASCEISLKLKELGFDEACLNYYHNDNENIDDPNYYLWDYCNTIGIKSSELQSNKGMENFIAAPLYQQVQKWLREVHNIHIDISYCGEHEDGHPAFRAVVIGSWTNAVKVYKIDCISPIEGDYYIFRSYELALEAAILESIKIISNEKLDSN
jgi:hypothetical protein